ncbi:MAG: hypothetical protein JNM68_13220 [Dinghuibacter sp.]|nr:hypothetical protein [Dinghuibacter sp.]
MSTDNILRYVLYTMEGLAAITGIIMFKRVKNTLWQWFVVYLVLIFLTELTGEFIYRVYDRNVDVYIKWAIPLQFFFFCWLFFRYASRRSDKWVSVACALAYAAAFVTETFLLKNPKFVFTSLSYMTGNIILLLQIILFFARFTASNDILHYRQSQMFWVCIGLLVFYLATLPFFGLWNNLRKYHSSLFNNYWRVQTCLAAGMYGFFAASFIWNKKN